MSVRVIACVVSRQDQLLVCQRPLSKRHGGLWEFPGGKVESGESDEATARRELLEELGVEMVASRGSEFSIQDPDSPFEIVFLAVSIHGEPRCHEHTGLRWGTPAQLLSLPMAPSDRCFLDHLLDAS